MVFLTSRPAVADGATLDPAIRNGLKTSSRLDAVSNPVKLVVSDSTAFAPRVAYDHQADRSHDDWAWLLPVSSHTQEGRFVGRLDAGSDG